MAFMGGLAVVGGIGGAAMILGMTQRAWIPAKRGWLYGGVGAGVAIGGTVGYFAGRFIIARTIAKLEESNQPPATEEQA